MENILKEVATERVRQNAKWGIQNRSTVEWVAILTEEVGEVAKEAVDFYFANGVTDVHAKVSAQVQLERLEAYRMECIQVAAVAVQMVENVDRGLKGKIYDNN